MFKEKIKKCLSCLPCCSTAFLIGLFVGPPFLQQCGSQPTELDRSFTSVERSFDSIEENIKEGNQSPYLLIPFNVVNEAPVLSLVASHDYTYKFRMNGCESGYEAVGITQEDSHIKVFQGDRDCRVELYQISDGQNKFEKFQDFITYSAGDEAVFAHPDNPHNLMRLTVISQLSSPIEETDSITYSFRQVDGREELDVSLEQLRISSAIQMRGMPSPSYSLDAIQMDRAREGVVPVAFYLNCLSSGSAEEEDFFCEGQQYSSLEYVFVEKPEFVTMDSIETLFGENSRSLASDASLSHNGFRLPVSLTLDEMMEKKIYLLSIKNQEGSYTYYTVEVI